MTGVRAPTVFVLLPGRWELVPLPCCQVMLLLMLWQVLGSTHVRVQQQVLVLLPGRCELVPLPCCQAMLLLML